MEQKENKHNHHYTKKLKVLLFGTLMFLPLLLLGSKSLVYVFNENQSTENYQYIQKRYLEDWLPEQTNEYMLTGYYEINDTWDYKNIYLETKYHEDDFTVEECNFLDILVANYETRLFTKYNYVKDNDDFDFIIYYFLQFDGRYYYWEQADQETEYNTIFNYISTPGLVEIDIIDNDATENPLFKQCFNKMFKAYIYEEIQISQTESTILEISNSSILSWTKNSLLYQNVNSAVVGLGINNLFIIELLIYWLDLTAIYIVIDIVIELFTWLTHILTKGKRLDE